MDHPRVSVVLPIFNSERDVLSSIGEIEKQTYYDYELIVVDDGSTDRTLTIAEQHSRENPRIKVVRCLHLGPSHARNAGLAVAKGDIIVFIESDCVYDDSYLSKAVAELDRDPGASAVCLTGAPLITKSTLATRCIDIENKVQHKLLSEGKIKPFYAWVYRKADLAKLGGFDERLFQAEDRDLFRRMEKVGYRVSLVPGINWRHRRDQSISDLSKKWFSRGRTRILYTVKHGLTLEALRTMLPLWATVVGIILLANSPLIGLGILVIVASAFIASSVRIASISWSLVREKRDFLAYPFFVLVRNFSTALGYSSALPMIISRKSRRREVSWESM